MVNVLEFVVAISLKISQNGDVMPFVILQLFASVPIKRTNKFIHHNNQREGVRRKKTEKCALLTNPPRTPHPPFFLQSIFCGRYLCFCGRYLDKPQWPPYIYKYQMHLDYPTWYLH